MASVQAMIYASRMALKNLFGPALAKAAYWLESQPDPSAAMLVYPGS